MSSTSFFVTLSSLNILNHFVATLVVSAGVTFFIVERSGSWPSLCCEIVE